MTDGTGSPDFRITQKKAPATARRGRKKSDLYPRVIQQFIESGIDEGLIEIEGKKPTALQAGLTRTIKELNAPVRVKKFGDEIYLSKKLE